MASTYVFRTPYVQRRVPVCPPVVALMNFSLAVLLIQGQWVETEWPSEEQIEAADLYFPGGYEIPVDGATAQLLMSAGYLVDGGATAGGSLVGMAVVGSAVVGEISNDRVGTALVGLSRVE